jgi:hypothetical protein
MNEPLSIEQKVTADLQVQLKGNVMNIDIGIARKVLSTVDAGLVSGVGKPVPGQMCVEAAVCYALGLPHGDDPKCVAQSLRKLKIRLNDSNWSSDEARAKGLRRLALIQLGSAGNLDEIEFVKRCARLAIQTCVPQALRAAARLCKSDKKEAMLNAADLCERAPTSESAREAKKAADTAYAAYTTAADVYTAAYAADAAYDAAIAYADAARDTSLAAFAEGVVQILIDMKVPGAQWLELTEEAA